MAIKKPAIPAVTPSNIGTVLGALKETVEVITGARGAELTQLETTATLAQTIAKVNQIVARLNASGN